MVERFHRHLKSALKTQPTPDAWMDTLPLILLGIRTALKEDISSTAAEMVYGTTIRLPGEFINPSQTTLPDSSEFINQLRAHMRTLTPTSSRSTLRPSSIPATLSTSTHVFVRHDGVRKPLQPPYDGPYAVVKKTDKHFTLSINGRNDTVSIDRLKPAHLDTDIVSSQSHSTQSTPNQPPHTTLPSTTRSGRRVHFPKYLSHNV